MGKSAKRTPLFDAHKASGARMVPFGGWDMPVSYTGIIDEHRTVRSAIGVFDVSHMGEIVFSGAAAKNAVQHLCTNAVSSLQPGAAMYTVMCYPDGGIVDDCIVYCRGEQDYLVIVNASNIDKDWTWMQEQVGSHCKLANESDQTALIAVQGPKARELVDRLADADLSSVAPFHFVTTNVAGKKAMVARTGYTGEDGFELACGAHDAVTIWNTLLDAGGADGIKPIGLGARDTLRLEAKLCLYGNDINKSTTPLEAGLGWVVKPDAGDFVGRDALLKQKAEGISRKLIGFNVQGRGIARHGYTILDEEGGDEIGQVTSGTTSPTLGVAIGMGYVPKEHSKIGTTLAVNCRGKVIPIEIHKGPFYKRGQPS